MIKLAACQYAIELIEGWDDYLRHLTRLVEEATAQGAELLLMPEYAGLVLAGQLDEATRSDLHGSIAGIQPLIPRWLELCEALARKHRIVFQPGSAPVLDHDGQYRNRAWLFGPDGIIGHQDKQIMTRFEREQWGIAAGVGGLRAFETPLGTLGPAVCWDQWYPETARSLTLQGAEILLYPTAIGTEPHDPDLDTSRLWRRAMIGHAVSNVVPVVAANRIGTEHGQRFYGHSFICDERGDILAEFGATETGVIVADLDLAQARRHRAAFGFFRDRRPDLYGRITQDI